MQRNLNFGVKNNVWFNQNFHDWHNGYTAVIGGGVYVMKLRSDNAILKANAIKMESTITEQQELITKQKEDFQEILDRK